RRSARRHLTERPGELLDIRDVVLEQVTDSGSAAPQQLVRILGLRELGEQDDPGAWVIGADLLRGVQALDGMIGRHPDIRNHDVRPELADGGEQAVEIVGARHQLYLWRGREQRRSALPEQVVILREHDTNRHPPPAFIVGTDRGNISRLAVPNEQRYAAPGRLLGATSPGAV